MSRASAASALARAERDPGPSARIAKRSIFRQSVWRSSWGPARARDERACIGGGAGRSLAGTRSLLQLGLQRLQLIEFVGKLVAPPAVGSLGHVFLGALDHASEHRWIELVLRHGHVREHGQAGGADLGEA